MYLFGNRAARRTSDEADKARSVEFQSLEGRLANCWAEPYQHFLFSAAPSVGYAVGSTWYLSIVVSTLRCTVGLLGEDVPEASKTPALESQELVWSSFSMLNFGGVLVFRGVNQIVRFWWVALPKIHLPGTDVFFP